MIYGSDIWASMKRRHGGRVVEHWLHNPQVVVSNPNESIRHSCIPPFGMVLTARAGSVSSEWTSNCV